MVESQDQEFEKVGTEIKKKVKKRILDYSSYFLTKEEIKKLKMACYNHTTLANTYLGLIMCMVNCGMRRNEVTKLFVSQVDFDNKLICLGLDTKTRTPRKIPFNEELERVFRLAIGSRKDGYVFMHISKGDSKRGYTKEQVNNIIATLGIEAGIKPKAEGMKNLNPHLFRHTFVKLCKDAGFDKNNVRVMGGWKDMKMIDKIYGVPKYDSVSKEYQEKMDW